MCVKISLTLFGLWKFPDFSKFSRFCRPPLTLEMNWAAHDWFFGILKRFFRCKSKIRSDFSMRLHTNRFTEYFASKDWSLLPWMANILKSKSGTSNLAKRVWRQHVCLRWLKIRLKGMRKKIARWGDACSRALSAAASGNQVSSWTCWQAQS